MVQQVQAIYENGILRPLEPLELEEHELVSLAVVRASTNGPVQSTEEQQALAQRERLLAFVAKMEAMPGASPPDGLSNRDHDRLIYGP